jgi:molybdenum cofactor cytidylyltransferase
MINGIILAAGESRRMGSPKALLPFKGKTFLEHIISVLKRCPLDAITVVLGADAKTIRESVDLSQTDVVINTNYKNGQLSSLVAGLKSLPARSEAVVVCLVDMPFVTEQTVDATIRTFSQTHASIVVPVYEGRRGHPVLFSKSVYEELQSAPPDEGARWVVNSNISRVFHVEVPDEGVVITINTRDEYKSRLGNTSVERF